MRKNAARLADLAVIVVSHNSAGWLEPCLRSVYAHAGGATLDVVVVDNDSSDGSAELGGGLLDERFFLYSEEPDLCVRIKRAGWQVRHMPQMTIVHHAGNRGVRPRMIAQDAYARKQYARKHFGTAYGDFYISARGLHHVIRALCARAAGDEAAAQRKGALRALRTLAGRAEPPFDTPPPTAVGQAVGLLDGGASQLERATAGTR